jgi:hypothetical protein
LNCRHGKAGQFGKPALVDGKERPRGTQLWSSYHGRIPFLISFEILSLRVAAYIKMRSIQIMMRNASVLELHRAFSPWVSGQCEAEPAAMMEDRVRCLREESSWSRWSSGFRNWL